MELKVSPEKPGFSSSDAASDTEHKEISEGEDEDDDRNHKHRRRDAGSQSQEGDSLDNHLTRPYQRRNRPFDNGYSYREGDPQSGEACRNYNIASDRDFPSRFDKRCSYRASFSKTPLEMNQGIRRNQNIPNEVDHVRGRGREPISWGICDSRFGLVDAASQIVQPGPVPSAMFAARGLPNVSRAHNTPWNAFGLVSGLHNGGLDSLHPLGLQGPLRPVINPPINIGLPRQWCRDFEERGFCLRGNMCPMQHGVNHIVIEDVQSLSQFNLPASLPGSQLPGASSAQGSLPVSSKHFHAKNSKPGTTEDNLYPNGCVAGGSMTGASTSDVYDPDQPLWTDCNPETSAALNQLNADKPESVLGMDLPDQKNIESVEGLIDDRTLGNATTAGSQSSSVWGRTQSSKRGLGVKGTPSSNFEQDNKTEKTQNVDPCNVPNLGKMTNVDRNGSFGKESSVKKQKALRTLFVNYIPLKDNKREALLSHFQKFGEVIDIRIPVQSERAYIQFSRSEEAQAALEAPDAVMGNRFIKLWWAYRDTIPVDGSSAASTTPPAVPNHCILKEGKENPHPATDKDSSNSHAYVAQQATFTNGSKAPPLQQKKLESLELLKEELRKKQEMLDQKRSEFRRQLNKLAKQAVGSKDMHPTEMIKGETPHTLATDETSNSSSRDSKAHTSTSNPTMPVHEPSRPFRSPAPVAKRFKLDNRPTAFRVVPPLPSGLGDVASLEEHFSSYGDLASVELEESNDLSARVSFTTRGFAERAFLHGKSWQGHKLQFMWLSSTTKEVGRSASSTHNHEKAVADEHGKIQGVAEDDSNSKSTSSSSEGELLVVE